jgi:4-amino-4-deoxy-L-arabinose transferase-like glycosyltransferase
MATLPAPAEQAPAVSGARTYHVWSPGLAAVASKLSLRRIAASAVAALPLALLFATVALVHGENMFGAPFYFDDEGIYVSQAWSVLSRGDLTPYTYFYDHPPVGWFTIAAGAKLLGGFDAFGASVNTGRALMLVVHMASALLVYGITRRLNGSGVAAALAVALFALSPFRLLFGREVLLDNLAALWMLVAVFFATAPRPSLATATASGLAMGIAVLNKEIVIPMIPGLVALLWVRMPRELRVLGAGSWLFATLGLASLYPLYAFLKGELFPYGSLLDFSSGPHVSLIGGVLFHQSRASDHGIFEAHSLFWRAFGQWWRLDPALVVGSLCAMLAPFFLAKWHRGLLGLGAMVFAFLAFLGRGGVVFEFWLLAVVPIVAIIVALTIDHARLHVRRLLDSGPKLARWQALASAGITLALIITVFLQHDAYAKGYERAFRGHETTAQVDAIAWTKRHLEPDAVIVIDTYAYVDLRGFDHAHSFWKVDLDPAIRDRQLGGDWRNIDYVVLTPVMAAAVGNGGLPIVAEAIDRSEVIARFEHDGSWVEVRRVKNGRPTEDQARARAIGRLALPAARHVWSETQRLIDEYLPEPSAGPASPTLWRSA